MLVNSLPALEDKMYREKEGMTVISNRDSEESTSIIISDDGITLASHNISSGISVSNVGVLLQGDILFTGKGTSIKKNNYSENPNSAKMFTYPETLYFESAAKEVIYKSTGESIGANLSNSDVDGFMPIITDPSTGGTGHAHTITMKHVHRVEPTYLYRVPAAFKVFTGSINSISDFFQTLGS